MRNVEIEFLPDPFPPVALGPLPPPEPGTRERGIPVTMVLTALACVAMVALSISPASPLRARSSPGQLTVAYVGLASRLRVLDTRDGLGSHPGPELTGPVITGTTPTHLRARTGQGPLVRGVPREFTVPDGFVPRDARAVAIEVTVLAPRRPGTLWVAVHDHSVPEHSHWISYRAAHRTTSLLAVDLHGSRAIELAVHGGDVDIVVTVVGYIVPISEDSAA